ncbi:hypothetical protein GCM10023116_45810 [Kistimonas scapharcae]|uniref:Uncharacterized protein n=1 Tax=Kistimonas scapharcae TaxID=1036133 RepID=A0ABP8V961_9GAMM
MEATQSTPGSSNYTNGMVNGALLVVGSYFGFQIAPFATVALLTGLYIGGNSKCQEKISRTVSEVSSNAYNKGAELVSDTAEKAWEKGKTAVSDATTYTCEAVSSIASSAIKQGSTALAKAGNSAASAATNALNSAMNSRQEHCCDPETIGLRETSDSDGFTIYYFSNQVARNLLMSIT